MPLYEYTCQECRHTFEALVFDGEDVECPRCKADRVERLLSVPAKPRAGGQSLPTGGCDPSLPPCGAPGCRRMGTG
jgi:putative FmdB family regulatory protein